MTLLRLPLLLLSLATLAACVGPVTGPTRYARVPPGHVPPAGLCRVWFPDRPPGHQPAPVRCDAIRRIPPGATVVGG